MKKGFLNPLTIFITVVIALIIFVFLTFHFHGKYRELQGGCDAQCRIMNESLNKEIYRLKEELNQSKEKYNQLEEEYDICRDKSNYCEGALEALRPLYIVSGGGLIFTVIFEIAFLFISRSLEEKAQKRIMIFAVGFILFFLAVLGYVLWGW